MTDERSFLQPADGVVARRLGDQIVLVQLETNQIYALNATGARLWELANDGSDRAQAVERILSEFDVTAQTLELEIDRLVEDLWRAGLVQRSG